MDATLQGYSSTLPAARRRPADGACGERAGGAEARSRPAPATRVKKRQEKLLREFARRAGDPMAGGSTKRPVMTAYRQILARHRNVHYSSAVQEKLAQNRQKLQARLAEIRARQRTEAAHASDHGGS
ncbi:MAG: hypothetical protein HC871_07590 [Rhizobiales bacterium]|nr:hypothetical protein [Hyphomicrobiales bacterium]